MSDLLEKEKVYRENEREDDDNSDRSDSSEGEESQSERRVWMGGGKCQLSVKI